MAGKKINSCLIGCGIGCLVLLIAGIALIAGGAVWVRGLTRGFQDAAETRAAVEAELGEPADFTPAADGSIAAERLDVFLTIREATAESRAALHSSFETLPLDEQEARELDEQGFFEKMGSVVGITSSAFGLAGQISDFFVVRNTAFAEHGMGLGEYGYIYVLAYYSWLGKSPQAGRTGDRGMSRNYDRAYSRVRRHLISNLENQLALLSSSSAEGGAEAAPNDLRRALQAEIRAMRDDRRRVPWQDGLPAPIEESLRPFRGALEASYDLMTDPFEIVRMEQHGNFHFEVD